MNIRDFCFCAAKCVNMPVIYASCLEAQTLNVKSPFFMQLGYRHYLATVAFILDIYL